LCSVSKDTLPLAHSFNMYGYPDQPTPPLNLPYQERNSRNTSSLESAYPSPAHQCTHTKYTQGLGIYAYPSSLPTDHLPPSPQPSEAWHGHLPSGVSPLMTDTIADPWTSGAFDHPVSHSPLPWASSHTSPRSSLSSCTREMSVYSHEGSEQAFTNEIKAEYPWQPEMSWEAADAAEMHGLTSSRTSSLTVAPERLSSNVFPYDHSYSTASVAKLESNSMYGQYDGQEFERAPSEDSTSSPRSKPRSNYSAAGAPRERGRNRRHTSPTNAPYTCKICTDKGFARRYNYNQHMLTHEANRKKDNICSMPGCGKEFVRKTDLARHDQSVHQKTKPFQCSRCPNRFSRKDTLRR
jgi:hypothetical protein